MSNETDTKKPTVWDMRRHRDWGNAISWMDWDIRRLVGHTQPRPKVGDELIARMESGKLGRFRFTEVDLQHNPKDMWFGTVEDVGYITQEQVDKLKDQLPKPPIFLV